MRLCFKLALPVAQAASAIALIELPGPRILRMIVGPVGAYHPPPDLPTGVIRLIEANLPAVPVLLPLYDRLGGRDHANTQWLIWAFGLVGIGIWFFVGYFLDDVVTALSGRLAARRHILDRLFSAFVIASACLVLIESDVVCFGFSLERPFVRVDALFWVALGCITLAAQASWARRGGRRVHLR
jgi:hypothetical protein